MNIENRIKILEDKFHTDREFTERMEEIFSEGSYEKLTPKDAEKLHKHFPDKFQILTDETCKQMREKI